MKQIDHGTGGAPECMRIVDASRPRPRPGGILIEVAYAGVNRPDVAQRMGHYPPPPGASPVLGLEVAGRVVELGEGVQDWRIGDSVCALVPGGGYAEYCAAPATHVLPIPDSLSLAQAAGLPENWFTVWANLIDHGRLKKAERVLIHGGSSGIGLAAIQLVRHTGAEAVVTVGSEQKAQFCRDFGARAAINYRTQDFVAQVKELTAGEGVDVVLDMVGAPYMQKNLGVLRADGRLVLIAFLQGSRTECDFTPVMRKRLTVTGSTMRPRTVEEKALLRDALLRNIWPALASGQVRAPHVHAVFPLEHAADAHRLMESSAHIGKIVLQVRG